jgi:hypothetical protein
MYRRLKSVSDTYITNKIIREARRKNANVGQAGTLDLFKLYNLSQSGSANNVTELSRVLIKFDLSELQALTSSILDYSDSSFRCIMTMSDVYGGQTIPSNFTIEAFPLSRSFDEGIGSDVVYFNDIDASNFVTSSFSGAPELWSQEGAEKGGLLGSSNIDYITSGNLGDGIINISSKQTFSDGTEDLSLDVTTIVSATLAGQVPDHGFRLAFTSSQESDEYTYFVKRFASRHTHEDNLKPRLVVYYDDTVQSNESDLFFDLSGSLFLYNKNRVGLSNIFSSSAEISGNNSLILKLVTTGSTGLITEFVTASQYSIGNNFVTGTYFASFKLDSADSEYAQLLANSGSAVFYPYWQSLDGTVGYFTGSAVTINPQPRGTTRLSSRNLTLNVTNLNSSYKESDKTRLRVFIQDSATPVVSSKIPLESKSEIYTNMYYSIRDVFKGNTIIPFETENNSTLMSTDADGMYFDLYMSDLSPGHTYEIDVMIKDDNINQMFKNIGQQFIVIKE